MCSKFDMCQCQFKSGQDWATEIGIPTLRQSDADGAWVLDLSAMSPHLSHCKTKTSRTQINNTCFSAEGMNNHTSIA
jgi:hypothetical protein